MLWNAPQDLRSFEPLLQLLTVFLCEATDVPFSLKGIEKKEENSQTQDV